MASSTPKTLTLISSDGKEFVVSESAAALSAAIKNIVEDGRADYPIPISEVHSNILCNVIVYLEKHGDETLSAEEKKNFDADFLLHKTTADLLNYIMAANYLDIKSLMDIVMQKITDIIREQIGEVE